MHLFGRSIVRGNCSSMSSRWVSVAAQPITVLLYGACRRYCSARAASRCSSWCMTNSGIIRGAGVSSRRGWSLGYSCASAGSDAHRCCRRAWRNPVTQPISALRVFGCGISTASRARYASSAARSSGPGPTSANPGVNCDKRTRAMRSRPVNAPNVEVHSYSKDGAMPVKNASDPVYAPNSYGGPTADPSHTTEALWYADGDGPHRTHCAPPTTMTTGVRPARWCARSWTRRHAHDWYPMWPRICETGCPT